MPVQSFQFGDLRLEGWSLAGDATWFRVHPPGLAFDAGRGDARLGGARDLFLSHGHLDHVLGVPFLLSHRTGMEGEATRVHCPAPLAEPLRRFVDAAAAVEGNEYRYQVVPLAPGERVAVGRGMVVEAFATPHVLPSLGYHLIRRRMRLAEPYRGLPGERLAALRRQGAAIEERVEEIRLTYCGDTSREIFDLEPRLFSSKVLVLECTFLGRELEEKGRQYGHLNFSEIRERAGDFRNEALVLHHLSRRHRRAELRALVDAEMPELAARVHLVGRGGDGSGGGVGPGAAPFEVPT
ncbi:MAG TPA: MBL fold metallo-hydrolase [Thermoanaerobaculia bacterium]|nr:MBL fold metallo-hydrolase [Thermoanaerobaculia bacterium]